MVSSTCEIRVAAGVILSPDRERVLLSWRDASRDQGGLWEYPGGKIEADESPAVALSRELREELGLDVFVASPLCEVRHDYGDKRVVLHFFVVEQFGGEAASLEQQAIKWWPVDALAGLVFPEANTGVAVELQGWLART